MKKRKIAFLILGLNMFFLVFGGFSLMKPKDNGEKVTDSKKIKLTNQLSMMLETGAGTGVYEATTRSTWPTDGYLFNSELSKCENGGKLSWNEENNTVVMIGSTSDKCYVYFDKVTYLAEYVKSLYTTQGSNGLYLHNSSLANSAGDNSYRYAGANPNNYVCFASDAESCPNDNLYRIIGVFGDKVKLIKADYANSNLLGTNGAYSTSASSASSNSTYKGSLTTINQYYWNNSTNSNVWSESNLNITNLNGAYLINLGTWANKIKESTWKVGGNTLTNIGSSPMNTVYQNEIVSPATATTHSAKIGLMYASDYGYAASPTYWTCVGYNSSDSTKDYSAAVNYNWMYMGLYEWTILRRSDDSYSAFSLINTGGIYMGYVGNYRAIRPCFYLNSSVTYVSGDGTFVDPIRVL